MTHLNLKNPINYELIALKLGDVLKWISSVKEIERIAKATLKIPKKTFPHENITSERAQIVYDWIMSIGSSALPEEEKKNRVATFVRAMLSDESHKARKEIMQLLGVSKLELSELPDFARIVEDASLAKVLENRWYEINKCLNSDAYLAAIIMMGSLLEGLLLAVVHSHPREANSSKSAPRDKQEKVKKLHQWSLTDLINVSYDCGWIELDAKDFSLELRDYRNMVHPWHQRAKQFHPDADTAAICWKVVEATLNDLTRNL